MRRTRLAALAAMIALSATVATVARPDAARSAEDAPAGITVTGTGTVATVPDRATFVFGVQTEAASASAALAANATAMRRVLDALRAAGIAAADLRTQTVSVVPRTSERGAIDGYTATNAVSALVRDLARVGAIVDAAVNAGANTVGGPELSRSNADVLYRDALRGAYADARAKAQVLAEATGVALGPVVRVVESSGSAPLPAAERAAADTPIAPGTQEVHASVTVTFGAP